MQHSIEFLNWGTQYYYVSNFDNILVYVSADDSVLPLFGILTIYESTHLQN